MITSIEAYDVINANLPSAYASRTSLQLSVVANDVCVFRARRRLDTRRRLAMPKLIITD
jgi:hypothetical protein